MMQSLTAAAASDRKAGDWPDHIKVSIWLVHEHGQWSALASEFDIAGIGRTERAALDNLAETLGTYLHSFLAEGATLDDARRPIPLREELRLRLRHRLDPIKARNRRSVQHSELNLTPTAYGAAC